MISREVQEGAQKQGADEKIIYSLTTTPWGSSPSNVAVVVKDVTENTTDVTGLTTSGSASVNGDVITLPKIQNLTAEHLYRVEVLFDAGGNTFEAYFNIRAEM